MEEHKGIAIAVENGKFTSSCKIILKGYLDADTAPVFLDKAREQVAQENRRIALDLKEVTFISSAGWGALITLSKEVQKVNGRLAMYDMILKVERVYKLFDFFLILPAYSDENTAWDYLSK